MLFAAFPSICSRTVVVVLVLGTVPLAAKEISFSRDIQPILARSCFACHGPDHEALEADLRLDDRNVAIDMGAITPGEPDESEALRRILSDDQDERMPPVEAGEKLSANEIELLRNWIQQGAKYEQHWSFEPPVRPIVPTTTHATWATWPINSIDEFILEHLLQEGMQPSSEADRYTLIRRVYLDLIGLPPTPKEADDFVNDKGPRAYENMVDRLLESKHYGERWARAWLDLARYSDTNGYEKDRPRSMWPYRDWVIRALNDDMPFDRFTIEQLAGDMLPNATVTQRAATGFHRNTMLNEEGGIDPLEYRFYAMVDRVATTGTVWLGMTTGCAQCHSHKYDPISQSDYYGLMAFMNNADEPDLMVPDPEIVERRNEIQQRIARLEGQLPQHFPVRDEEPETEQSRQKNLQQEFSRWLKTEASSACRWTVIRPSELNSNLPRLEVLNDGSIFSTGDITKRDVFTLVFPIENTDRPITALRLEVLPDERLPAGGPGRTYYEGRKGDFFLSELAAMFNGEKVAFVSASHSYGKISIGSGGANADNVIDGEGSTGWSTAGREGEAHQLVLRLANPIESAGDLQIELLFERHFAASLGRFRISVTADTNVVASERPVEIEALLARDRESWSPMEVAQLKKYFLNTTPLLSEARKEIEKLRKQLPPLPTTMVMQERHAENPRKTFRHHRGEYVSPREEVAPAIPAVFSPNTEQTPRNRLEFAQWLASDQNPLVARVAVNRAWQSFFGRGIVPSTDDFGTQSDPPTYPELLDWLACEFIEQGWSLKKLHRLIVTSATYRQTSRISSDALVHDRDNRWLARGPRFRVSAEMVRDLMLKAAGLLSLKMGGPSVYPPQPASVTALAYGGTKWSPSTGEDRYRRSIYTFSKRTTPFAAYTVFDAPSGEICVARRDRSNTPLQALTLLNDEMYVEMARALAETACNHEQTEDARATFIFRRLLTRPPTPSELEALLTFQHAQRRRFQDGELDASKVAGQENASPELASWIMVARAVMNLDETITKN